MLINTQLPPVLYLFILIFFRYPKMCWLLKVVLCTDFIIVSSQCKVQLSIHGLFIPYSISPKRQSLFKKNV